MKIIICESCQAISGQTDTLDCKCCGENDPDCLEIQDTERGSGIATVADMYRENSPPGDLERAVAALSREQLEHLANRTFRALYCHIDAAVDFVATDGERDVFDTIQFVEDAMEHVGLQPWRAK